MTYHPETPYNDLPLLPPMAEIETKVILKKTISASRALSELKGAITNLPNPALFIDTIQLQEAQASSAIENIVTTQDELFKSTIADKKPDNPAVKEVLHYKDALWHGLEVLKTKPLLSTNLFLELVQIVKENDAGIRNMLGVRLTNPATGKVIYTPPEGERVIQEKLKNLEEFIHADDGIDPLVKMAVIHYQFEAIHPFFDGNGRTGRIILLLYLIWKGLLELPALFLSGLIIKNKMAYYQKLLAVTEYNDWQGWILYMLDIIELSAGKDRKRIAQIERVMSETGVKIREQLPKLYTKDLMEVLFRLPYTKRKFLVDAGIGNPKTAGNYLNELEKAGFLKSERVGKEKLYLNHALLYIIRS
jgi:Fic family protein